jgi:erythromycin esterase
MPRALLSVLLALLGVWVALCLPARTLAQSDSLDRAERVRTLRPHVIPLGSVDPADTSFADLKPLSEAIGDRRIVFLGEATHGDGTAFRAKSRLVKFLHQEMGFRVLAFESGLYDLRRATRQATTPQEHLRAATQTLARPWAQSAQARPVLRYYAQTQHTDAPLHLAGIDGALRPPNDSVFVARLKQRLREQALWQDVAGGTGFEATLQKQLVNPLHLARDTAAYRQFLGRLNTLARQLGASPGAAAADRFWALMLENVKAMAQTGFQRSYEPRNRQMARNLVWLAEEAYPEQKLIVWGASSHGIRNLSSIERIHSDRSYDGQTSMGDVLAARFDGGVYTLGVTAHGGRFGAFYWRDAAPKPIDAPSDGSLEALLGALPHDAALLDFTDVPPDHWLREPQVARPLGYEEMRANWTQVMDGLLFLRTMQPNTKVAP